LGAAIGDATQSKFKPSFVSGTASSWWVIQLVGRADLSNETVTGSWAARHPKLARGAKAGVGAAAQQLGGKVN